MPKKDYIVAFQKFFRSLSRNEDPILSILYKIIQKGRWGGIKYPISSQMPKYESDITVT